MRKSLLFIPILLSSCTTTTDISSSKIFEGKFSNEVQTKRVTYIYNFNNDSIYELWDHKYEYYQGYQARERFVTEPIAVCSVGSRIKISKIYKEQKFDNPQSVKAKGTILCNNQTYTFSYIFGLGNSIHQSPWESEKYEPHTTQEIY